MSKATNSAPVLEPLDRAKLARRFHCRTPAKMAFKACGKTRATCSGCCAYCNAPREMFKAPAATLAQAEMKL